mmetsp:Transcript_102709/g.331422  ORF Transcript_102709/g.331422 Transcript_102709/m.331422 type:complete len:202 (+) Transcript_102709:849-1454(+)
MQEDPHAEGVQPAGQGLEHDVPLKQDRNTLLYVDRMAEPEDHVKDDHQCEDQRTCQVPNHRAHQKTEHVPHASQHLLRHVLHQVWRSSLRYRGEHPLCVVGDASCTDLVVCPVVAHVLRALVYHGKEERDEPEETSNNHKHRDHARQLPRMAALIQVVGALLVLLIIRLHCSYKDLLLGITRAMGDAAAGLHFSFCRGAPY